MSNNSSQKGTIAVLASTNRKRRSSDKAAVWATELGRAHEAVDIIHVNLKDFYFPDDGEDPESNVACSKNC